MDTPYAWHPGSDRIAVKDAVPVSLLPDEIISSWLVRHALAQGCEPYAFCRAAWPDWPWWSIDIDRGLSEDHLKSLSVYSGISPESLDDATLSKVSHQFGAGLHGMIWPWFLSYGVRRARRRNGLQYCPHCLAEDPSPYFRIQWRFAWHTACDSHGCRLLDCCHACAAPIDLQAFSSPGNGLYRCAACDADLRLGKTVPSSRGAIAFQRIADGVVREKSGRLYNVDVRDDEWFATMNVFGIMIRRTRRIEWKPLAEFLRILGVDVPFKCRLSNNSRIELLRAEDRERLFEGVQQMIMMDHEAFTEALKKSKLTRQGFCLPRDALSPWLEKLVQTLPDCPKKMVKQRTAKNPYVPTPRCKVRQMMARLEHRLKMERL
jgi:hypothetical protein